MALVSGQTYVPVASSWVRQFILTVSNELVVQFRTGICCYYPGTTRDLFEVAIVSPSPGRFVHEYLYKKRPYKIVPMPVFGVLD